MFLSVLFAAIAAIPAVTAQQSSATPIASYSPYPLIVFDGTTVPLVTGSPMEPPSNFTAMATPGINSDQSQTPQNVTATIISDLSGNAPLNATNGTMNYTTMTVTSAVGMGYLPAPGMQNVTSTSTSASTTMACSTVMGFERRSSVPTVYEFRTTTSTISTTSTTYATVTVTPTASTFTGVVTSTLVVTTTSFSTPAQFIVPTPAGFNPLFAFAPAAPTANSRIKRFDFGARDAMEALSLLKRQTPAGNTGGIRVDRNGTTSNIYRRFPQQLNCTVSITMSRFVFVAEQGPAETVFADVDAATSMSTVEVTSTTTVTSVGPQETVWAACQGNNVVNSVEGTTGDVLIFDRVIYRPMEGFPLANEIIVPTEDATQCCIECQKTPFCAGSIYAPSEGQCHIRLTQAPPSNNNTMTLPGTNSTSTNSTLTPPFLLPNSTLSALSPTGTSPTSSTNPLSTASPTPNTCTGSRGFYLGTIQGQTDFPLEYALYMSNGPCGRLSVWPVPVNSSLDTSLQGPPVPVRRGLGM